MATAWLFFAGCAYVKPPEERVVAAQAHAWGSPEPDPDHGAGMVANLLETLVSAVK